MRLAALCLTVLMSNAGGVFAQTDERAYAPTAFSEFFVWANLAMFVDETCDQIEIDQGIWAERYSDAIQSLEEAGIAPGNWQTETKGIPPGIADRPRGEFFFKYGARPEDVVSVCMAAITVEDSNDGLLSDLIRALP